MYPSSARLFPDDQSDERAFFARDLDEERDLSKQTVKRGHRHDAMRRPSIGTRILRSLARFFAAVLIGIGLTLAWQSYGEQAKQQTQLALCLYPLSIGMGRHLPPYCACIIKSRSGFRGPIAFSLRAVARQDLAPAV